MDREHRTVPSFCLLFTVVIWEGLEFVVSKVNVLLSCQAVTTMFPFCICTNSPFFFQISWCNCLWQPFPMLSYGSTRICTMLQQFRKQGNKIWTDYHSKHDDSVPNVSGQVFDNPLPQAFLSLVDNSSSVDLKIIHISVVWICPHPYF